MNNPLNLVQIFRNPEPFMRQILSNNQAMQNPIIQNAMDMRSKNDEKGLEQMARNLCKEKGIDLDGFLSQLNNQK